MAAGNTYTPIATTTLGSTASSYTFSSISGSYTDLVLVINGALDITGGWAMGIVVNGDTTYSNYSMTELRGNGTAAASSRLTSASGVPPLILWHYGFNTAIDAMSITSFMNYSNATTYKTFLTRSGRTGAGLDATASLWRSTAAITSIQIVPQPSSGALLQTGSTFSLYGILAA